MACHSCRCILWFTKTNHPSISFHQPTAAAAAALTAPSTTATTGRSIIASERNRRMSAFLLRSSRSASSISESNHNCHSGIHSDNVMNPIVTAIKESTKTTTETIDKRAGTITAAASTLPKSNTVPKHQRVWKSRPSLAEQQQQHEQERIASTQQIPPAVEYWYTRVRDLPDWDPIDTAASTTNVDLSSNNDSSSSKNTTTTNIPIVEGRMRPHQLGVLHQDPAVDMQLLVDNYTVKAVASALRDREDALQQAAVLAANQEWDQLRDFLQIFHPKYVLERRRRRRHKHTSIHHNNNNQDERNKTNKEEDKINVKNGESGSVHSDSGQHEQYDDDPSVRLGADAARQVLRKALMRMPRTITTAHTKRAAVCLALCLVDQVPCLLLEKRAKQLRTHPDQVCLPGGMVCDIQDKTIVSTSIREMKEEIGGLDVHVPSIEVLGVLRLNWGEVQHLTGVAVTPVVCYLGELPNELTPNPNEVAEVFTIPLLDLLDKSNWVHKDGLAPIFVGGPHVIWGLTGYILERFGKDILRPLRQDDAVDNAEIMVNKLSQEIDQ